MTRHFRNIGRRMPALDAREKVTGTLKYTQDIVRPGMLHGAILRSPHCHARIRRIDVAGARAMPGVKAVITGADFPGGQYVNFGPAFADRYPLAMEKVRFRGEEVAAVAAETLAQARAALAAIEVDYELLPASFTPENSLEPHAPEIDQKAGLPRNVAQWSTAKFGELDQAFAEAAFVIRGTFRHGAVAPICLETNTVVADFHGEDATIEVWAGTQAPFFARKEIAHVLKMETEKVFIRSSGIGGGFGGKSQSPEPIAIACLLSVKSGRPVRIALDRWEEFVAGKTDHAKVMTVSTAVAADGTLLGRYTDYLVDNGAYTYMGPAYISAVRQRTCNLYRVGAAGFDGKLVYSNKVPGGSYRGMGAPQIIWAIESQIDEIANRLGRDRLEYRLAIANQPGDTTPLGWKITTCGLSDCLREAGRRIGWVAKSTERRPWRGLGIAAMVNPSVGVLYPEGNFAHVSLELRPDGTFLLGTQTSDCGTAQNTVLAQFAAEALDVDVHCIEVLHMDTENAPPDLGSAASRVTFVSGAAAIRAGEVMASEIKQRLSVRWSVLPDQIEFRDGIAAVKGDNMRRLDLREIAALEGNIKIVGRHDIELPRADARTGFGHYAPTYGFGALAAEVEVDPETGVVNILKIVSVQDIGRVINPLAMEGQAHGAIVQGIGMALHEELVFDHGEPINASLISYKVPRIGGTPPIELAFVETNDATGPFGAKAGGEHPINMTVAAIANAIADATGVHFSTLPITPQKILSALKARSGTAPSTQPWRRPYNLEVATARALYPSTLFPALKAMGGKLGRPVVKGRSASFLRPATLDEAVSMLAQSQGRAKVIAGGTDLQVGLRQGVYQAECVVDVSRLAELKGIEVKSDHARIGAGTTISAIMGNDELAGRLPMLRQGFASLATRQIRNVATLGGDLCQQKRCWFLRGGRQCYKHGGMTCPCYAVTGDSRHHAIMGAGRCAAPCVADAAPILASLGAVLHAIGPGGMRQIAMAKFYRWSGETDLAADEILTDISIPLHSDPLARSFQNFEKFADWQGDFAEASVATSITFRQGVVSDASIAFGGVAPLPMSARKIEDMLRHKVLDAEAVVQAASVSAFGALPLRDNAAKVPLLQSLVKRSLSKALEFANQH